MVGGAPPCNLEPCSRSSGIGVLETDERVARIASSRDSGSSLLPGRTRSRSARSRREAPGPSSMIKRALEAGFLLWLLPAPAYAHAVGPGSGVEIELLLVAGAVLVFGYTLRSSEKTLPMKACASVEKSRRRVSLNPRNRFGSGTT